MLSSKKVTLSCAKTDRESDNAIQLLTLPLASITGEFMQTVSSTRTMHTSMQHSLGREKTPANTGNYQQLQVSNSYQPLTSVNAHNTIHDMANTGLGDAQIFTAPLTGPTVCSIGTMPSRHLKHLSGEAVVCGRWPTLHVRLHLSVALHVGRPTLYSIKHSADANNLPRQQSSHSMN